MQAQMLIGAGGFDLSYKDNTYFFRSGSKEDTKRVNITQALARFSPNVNAVSLWITKEWKESWYDVKTVQKEIIEKGYTPIFIFYWFADDISPKYIKEHEKEYFATLKRFSAYIQKLNGQKIVILNPEYNQFGTAEWSGMNDIFLKSFKMLREDEQVLVGPCVGDFGNYDYTDEPKEWKVFHPSLEKTAMGADFIAFQEMRALSRNSTKHIANTPKRALHLARYLHKRYNKATFLAYLAISTYGKGGEDIQNGVYKEFLDLIPQMKKEGALMGFNTFHYFDYPGHIGFFKEAEAFFGVIDKDGKPKKSLRYFKRME